MPAEFRTAVVIPTLFGSVEAVQRGAGEPRGAVPRQPRGAPALRGAERLHRRADRDPRRTTTPSSRPRSTACARSTRATPPDAQDAFYLFHRPRRWNPQRGRVDGLGAQARQARRVQPLRAAAAREDAFSRHRRRRRRRCASVRYVITLDADTVLPPDAAPLLVGALAHPLNRAVYDPARGRVVRGYGILQPRVGVSLPSAHRSRFAAIHSGHPGVDPYTTAVSDVYQDLYGEGSFTGKGIYDVDAFEQATHGRFPENTLLSHDLIEGNYARAGLATDIDRLRRLSDALPHLHPPQAPLDPRRLAAAALADARACPGPDGPEPNRLSLLSRWKILDNLRRSTVEIAQLAVPGRGLDACCPARRSAGRCSASAPSPRRGSSSLLLARAASAARQVVARVLRGGGPRRGHQRAAARARDRRSCRTRPGSRPTRSCARCGACSVSRRHLLEWQTASQTERGVSDSAPASSGARMWPAVALAAAILAAVVWRAVAAHRRGGAAPGSSRSRCCRWSALWLAVAVDRARAQRARRAARAPAAAGQPAARRCATRCCTGASSTASSPRRPTGSRPTTSRRTRSRSWRCARRRPTSACSCWRPSARYDLGFITLDEMTAAARAAPSARSSGCGASAATSTTGTTCDDLQRARAGVRLARWTAATWPGTSSRCARPASRWPTSRSSTPRVWRALDTALALADERLPALRRRVAALEQLRAGPRGARAGAREPVTARGALAARGASRSRSAEAAARRGAPARAGGRWRRRSEWIAWSRRLVASSHRGAASAELGAAPTRARCAELRRDLRPTAASSSRGSRRSPTARTATRWRWTSASCTTREREAVRDRLPADHPLARRLVLRSARLRGAAGELHGDRQERRAGRALVPPRPHADPRRRATPALVSWSGSMFEYLMPMLVMRSFPFTRARPDLPAARVRRQIAYGARARRALGRERERLQRARPPPHLSVPRLRRARPRAQARPGPRPGGRAVRLGARAPWSTRSGRSPTSRALEKQGRARAVRLPRRARLHPPRSRAALRRSCAPTWRTTSA